MTENLIVNNIVLAEKIAKFSWKKYNFVDYEELKSAAYLGLVQAANKYNPEKCSCFTKYASYRIFGAIKDYLRELNFFSRNCYKQQELIELDNLYYFDNNVDDFDTLVNCLPSKNKNIIKKYFLENKTCSEIAIELNYNKSRISQILNDSYLILKSVL